MDDTGIDYLPSPDGSQGGDGRTWAGADETTVKRSDGTYDIPYKPGRIVDLNEGDTILKYGHDIGKVIKAIKKGEHVHVHNVKTKKW